MGTVRDRDDLRIFSRVIFGGSGLFFAITKNKTKRLSFIGGDCIPLDSGGAVLNCFFIACVRRSAEQKQLLVLVNKN